MSSLKGDRGAQRKRRLLDKHAKKNVEKAPRMEPNIRVKKINLDTIQDILSDDD